VKTTTARSLEPGTSEAGIRDADDPMSHEMNEPTTQSIRSDFHCALLWLRSIEIVIGHSPAMLMAEINEFDLFSAYVSPIIA
jgi:hypothetical protein